jgi:hypothetical protein
LESVAVYILHGKEFLYSLNASDVLTSGRRKAVYPLVNGVPGSCYTGFRSYEGAFWDYSTAKKDGKVRAVRDPGDEFLFGPISGACM